MMARRERGGARSKAEVAGILFRMAVERMGEDRVRLTWEDLGKPRVKGDYPVSGLGIVVFDDADVYYAVRNPDSAAFFVRPSAALGPGHWVVISRVHKA